MNIDRPSSNCVTGCSTKCDVSIASKVERGGVISIEFDLPVEGERPLRPPFQLNGIDG